MRHIDKYNAAHCVCDTASRRLTPLPVSVPCTGLREGPPSTLFDRAFENELNIAVARTHDAYERLLFREALKCAGYDLANARDVYRFACGPDAMNRGLVLRYIELSALLLAPITPHTSEHVWGQLLHRPGSVLKAGWPAAAAPDYVMQRAAQYIEGALCALRQPARVCFCVCVYHS